jgi:hypothetical protein
MSAALRIALILINGFAAEIREGARMHVKENSMWFQSSSEHEVEVKTLPVGGRFDNSIWWVDDKDCVE